LPCGPPKNTVPDFVPTPNQKLSQMAADTRTAKIARTGAENQHDSEASLSIVIAIFRTHNPLVPGSNPGGPTIFLQ